MKGLRVLVRLTFSAVLSAVLVSVATPASANSTNYFQSREAQRALPNILDQQTRVHYRAVFDAIEAEKWERVEDLLDDREDGLLHQVALAEYYTHANSPRVSAEQISDWLDQGTSLPQAEQLIRLGERRGLSNAPSLPRTQTLRRQSFQSRRVLPRSTDDGTMPEDISREILTRIRDDDPDGARRSGWTHGLLLIEYECLRMFSATRLNC